MPKRKTITLSLTEEELNLIEKSIITEMVSRKDDIELGDEYPDNNYFAEAAKNAKAALPLLSTLYSRIIGGIAHIGGQKL